MSDESANPPRARPRLPPPPQASRDPNVSVDGLRPDDLIDARYRVQAQIGEGGVGCVYRANQFKLGRDVAVKVLRGDEVVEGPERERFEREAMAMATLNHPNIVSVQDYGVWRGRPFLVMELLEGCSLRERLDHGPLPEEEALRLLRELLYAMAYAHEKGVVHRDLKPANVFLQSFPTQPDHLKVLDFGFAKFVGENALARAAPLTAAGTTMGTPSYLSPERLTGSEVDGRSDLYSVGVLLFEMLAGEKPYLGEPMDVMKAHLLDPLPSLSERCPGLGQSAALTEFLARAMAKEVDARFADAGEMLKAMAELPRPLTFELGVGDGEPVGAGAAEASLPVNASTSLPARLRASFAPLAQRLPSRAQWEGWLQHGVAGVRGSALRARDWAERGYRWAAPHLRRGASRASALGGTLVTRVRERARGPRGSEGTSDGSEGEGPSGKDSP